MHRPQRPIPAVAVAALLALSAACDGEGNPTPIGPGGGSADTVFVLNSTGQTIAAFTVASSDVLAEAGDPIDQGAAFDGSSMDATSAFAVTTISAFGGSQVLFTDLDSGDVDVLEFGGSEPTMANPSRPKFDAAGVAWFAARARDAIYFAMPGDSEPTEFVDDLGTFVETVVPVPGGLAAVDAFLDDDGGSYTPFGPSRVFLLNLSGTAVDTVELPDGALNAIDAVVAGGKLVVLLGGTFVPETFAPAGDGALVTVDPGTFAVGDLMPLDANGVAIEVGGDGLVYVTTTNDFVETDGLSFDAAAGDFVAGPDAPLDLRGTNGGDLDCWSLTAFADGRLLCATFSTVEQGQLYLLDETGQGLDAIDSGFGTTDILLR